MAVVGSAEVVVRAITTQVKKDIEKAFADARPVAQKSGKDFANDWGKAFSSEVAPHIDAALSQAFSLGGKNAKSAGRDHGRQYGEAVAAGAAGAAGNVGGALSRALTSAAGGAGRAFNRALDSAWADSASSASKAFTKIFALANIGGPAIAALVSGASALVSGLFAVASSAAVAAGSLAVIPGIIGVAAQAMGALKLAFSGVGGALSAGLKEASGNAAQSAANLYAVADARKALARAYQAAARAQYDADQRVADAAGDVADAEQDVLNVTKALTQARKDAAEQLQQLAFSAEDAALAEQRAGLTLEDAYKKLQAAQALPPDDRNRREAELSYKEAELAFREAKDKNSDLAKEQSKAAKAGVEGSKEVIDAKKKVGDAQDTLADKEKDLADARLARRRQEIDSAQAIADAQEALRRAMEKGSTAANAYKTALANLSPPAQKFVKYLVSLQDEFKKLKNSAGIDLFPQLQKAIEPVVDKLFPVLETQLRRTGGILGQFAVGLSNAVTRGSMFRDLLKSQNDTLDIFNRRGANGKTVIDDLATVLLRVMTVIQPLTQRFASWVASLVEGAEAATDTAGEMNILGDFLDKAGDRAALLGDIVKNIVGIFWELGKAADPAGTGLLEDFRKYTAGLKELLSTPEKQDQLKQYFKDVADNVRAIARLVRAVGRAFGGLGDNKGVGTLADKLIPAVEGAGRIADTLTTAAPGLGDLATHVVSIVEAFTDSAGIKIFLGTLDLVAQAVDWFVHLPVIGFFVGILGAVHGVIRALGFLRGIFSTIFKVMLGGFVKPLRRFRDFRKGGSDASKGLDDIKSSSDKTMTALEEQMGVDKLKIDVLKRLATQAGETAGALGILRGEALPGADEAGQVAAAAELPPIDTTAAEHSLVEFDKKLESTGGTKRVGKFKGAMKGIGGAFKGLGSSVMGLAGGPMGLLLTALPLVIAGFMKLYKSSPQFKAFVDGIVKAVKPVIEAIGKFLIGALDKFFTIVNEKLPPVAKAVVGFFKAIGSWIADHFMPIWNALIPVFKVLWAAITIYAKLIWTAVSTYFKLIVLEIKIAVAIIKFVFMNILVPIFKNVLLPILKVLWDVAKAVFNGLKTEVQIAFAAIQFVWQTILRPVFRALRAGFQAISDKAGVVTDFLKDRWNDFKRVFGVVADAVRRGVNRIKTFFQGVVDKIGTVVQAIKDKFAGFKTALQGVVDNVKEKVKSIKDFFGEIPGAITTAFSNLGSFAKTGINAFIDFLNTKFIAIVNKVTSNFGLTIPDIPKLAQGGRVTGPGGPTDDRVPLMGSRDEYMVRARSARRLGYGTMDYINRTGQLPPGGTGGLGWPRVPHISLSELRDLAGDAVGGIKDVGEEIAKKGLGKVLEELVKGASAALSGSGFKREGMGKLFYGIMDKLAEAAGKWGRDAGAQASGTIPPAAAPWVYPLSRKFPITQYPNRGHKPPWSVDFGAPDGTSVLAASAGQLFQLSAGNRSYGRYIEMQHANGIKTLYAHLSAYATQNGAVVAAGTKIGKVGHSGNVRSSFGGTGAHLHFEIIPSADTLEELRKRGVKFAAGGVAMARPGGVLSVLAEAGRNERVEPLGRDGFSARDRAMIDLIKESIATGGGRGDSFHVHPAPGMDEAALAHMVSRRVAWRRSVGT